NQIKAVDPTYSDLTCDLRVDSTVPAPSQETKTYTVKPGDSLWKIAQEFYGAGHLFKRIIEANPGKLVDENSVIHPGDKLTIPAEQFRLIARSPLAAGKPQSLGVVSLCGVAKNS